MKKLTTILPFALSILIGCVFGYIWVEKIHIGDRNIVAFAYYIAAPTVLWIFFLCASNVFRKRKYVISLILGGASLAFLLGFGAQIKADFGFPVVADNSNEKPAAIAEHVLWAANDG